MIDKASELIKTLSWKSNLILSAHRAARLSKKDNTSTYFQRIRYYHKLYRSDSFLPEEAVKLGFGVDAQICTDGYISKYHMTQRQSVLNPPSFQVLTEDKSVFYSYCMHMNIPVPRLLGIFYPGGQGYEWGQGAIAGKGSWSCFFENECPDEFVIKASTGVYGDGIYFIEKKTDFSGAKLFDELNGNPKFNSFVVQECLNNHPDLMKINPKKGLQTVRVITNINKNGEVEILLAYFKPIVGNNRVDNHKSGKTGNLISEIDLTSGSLKQPILITSNGPVDIVRHPDTGNILEGSTIPLWDLVCETVKATAVKFLPMRAIGWDVAITADGVFIIEGNSRWDPPKFGNFGKNKSVFED